MSREGNLLKNTFVLSIGVFLPKLVGFITLPLLTAYLTTAEYGTYDLVTVLASLVLPAATLQIQTAAFRFLIDSRDDKQETDKIITGIYAFIIPTSIIALVILFFVLNSVAVSSRLLICAYFLFDILENAARQIVRGLSDNKSYSVSSIISALGKMIFVVIFVWWLREGLNGALVCLCVSSALSLAYLCLKGNVLSHFHLRSLSKKKIREMVSYSWPMVPNSLSMWVMSVSDRFVLTLFMGVEVNAVYAVANKIPSILALARTTFTMAWQENASTSYCDKDAPAYYSKMYDKMIGIMTGCLALLIAATPVLFAVLIKGDYADAYYQMPILFAATLMDCLSSFLGGIYVAFKRTRNVGLTTITAAGINLLIDFLFVNKIGVYAASISTLVSYTVLVAFRMINIRKFVPMKYNYKTIVQSILLIIAMCFLCYQQNTVCNVINVAVGILAFWLLCRELIIGIIKSVLVKRRAKGR